MKIACIWEHNGDDTLLYARDLPGAFTRGASLAEAVKKMPAEAGSWLRWCGEAALIPGDVEIVQEKASELMIRDADSDVLFDSERLPLTMAEYERLKTLALRSAADFHALFEELPQKDHSDRPERPTFYDRVPRTAREMYGHTRSVNTYYFGEIGVEADAQGSILECRERGFRALESRCDFLENTVLDGSYGEEWSLRKVLRRFLWHDRIHARAMYRLAVRLAGKDAVPDPFCFSG